MDLLRLLREEHSKKQTGRIVNYIGDDQKWPCDEHLF
jgi:hypothetical protein